MADNKRNRIHSKDIMKTLLLFSLIFSFQSFAEAPKEIVIKGVLTNENASSYQVPMFNNKHGLIIDHPAIKILVPAKWSFVPSGPSSTFKMDEVITLIRNGALVHFQLYRNNLLGSEGLIKLLTLEAATSPVLMNRPGYQQFKVKGNDNENFFFHKAANLELMINVSLDKTVSKEDLEAVKGILNGYSIK